MGTAGDSAQRGVTARSVDVLATVLTLICIPVLTWWWVGDLSTRPLDPDEDDSLFPRWDFGHDQEMAAGIVAGVLIAVGCLVLARRGSYVRRGPWWLTALLPLAGVGFVLAVWWRWDTAVVTGGNFGAGFGLLLGPPIILGLVTWSLWQIQARRGLFVRATVEGASVVGDGASLVTGRPVRSAASTPTTPMAAVRVGIRRSLSGHGRAGRAEFWWFVLFCVLTSVAAPILWIVSGKGAHSFLPRSWLPHLFAPAFWLLVLVQLWLLVAATTAGVRRLHDIGRSGWWLVATEGVLAGAGIVLDQWWLVMILPFMGVMFQLCTGLSVLLLLGTRRSEPGPNRYGPGPVSPGGPDQER